MSIVAIDPGAVRLQSAETKKRTVGLDDFSAAMGAAAPAVATTVGLNAGYQPAAVTQAAISGIAATPQAFGANAPYYASTSSPTLSTNFALPPGGYNTSGATFAGGVNGTLPGGSIGVNGSIGTAGYSQDYQEKQQLFQQMNDANWEMLVAQVTVNEISRDYQARSNILKTKSDTELNAVRNMRA